MNAQEDWKALYRSSKKPWYSKVECRKDQLIIRREAALERKLEAANRRITELNNTIKNQDEIIARIAAGSFRALIQK